MKSIKLLLAVLALCVLGAFSLHRVVALAAPPQDSSRDVPKGLYVLGDPKDSPEWGLDNKWGAVKNFDHTTHLKPEYAKNCQVCHHTNTAALAQDASGKANEDVQKCIFCHKQNGNEKNPKSKSGDEIDVQGAYHGNPDNTTNQAGCTACHDRLKDAHPKAVAGSNCAGCHTKK